MSALTTASRRLRLRLPRLRLSRQRVRLMVAAAVISVLVLLGGWLLLRDSSLVAVEHVTVTGEGGPDAAAIRAALDLTARKMTTLDVQTGRLRAAVSGFPEVKGLRVSTQFPHGLVIHVIELLPVAAVTVSGHEVPVTGDGTLLTNVPVTGSLPLIALAEPPTGARLRQPWAQGAAKLLAAAPRRLLPKVAEVMTVAGRGLVVQIRSGPSLYFGDATQLQAKWMAVMAVLADPGSAGAEYIDVTDPARPAAGAGAGSTTQPAAGSIASTTTSSSVSAAGGTASGGSGSPASTVPSSATSTVPSGG